MSVLLQADATRLPLADQSVDLTVTSPPYALGIEYGAGDVDPQAWQAFMGAACAELYRVSKIGGRIAINVPLDTTRGWRPSYAETVQALTSAGFDYRSTIVWNEDNTNKSVARGSVDSASSPHIFARVEMVVLASRGPWKRGKVGVSDLSRQEWLTWTNGLWSFPGERRSWEKHPAAYPEELPTRLIKLLSFVGDVVLDPFCGSGTTLKVARDLGRTGVGVDIDRAYLESTARRLAVPQQAEAVA